MSAAVTPGQLVFVARPQIHGGGFDPAIVLENLPADATHQGTPFMVSVLLFHTDPSTGTDIIKPMIVDAEVHEDRDTAASQAPGNLTQPQSASFM